MTEPTLDTLNRRLNHLEREVHWWRLGTLAALLAVVVVGVLFWPRLPDARAARGDTVLEAEQVVIRDKSGRKRVMIGEEALRYPGQPPEAAKRNRPEFGLFVYGEDGKPLATLAAQSLTAGGGTASLIMMSPDEKVSASILLTNNTITGIDTAGFSLRSQIDSGRPGAAMQLVTWDDSSGAFSHVLVGGATNPVGMERHALLEWKRGAPTESSLVLFGKDDKVLWKAP